MTTSSENNLIFKCRQLNTKDIEARQSHRHSCQGEGRVIKCGPWYVKVMLSASRGRRGGGGTAKKEGANTI